MNHSNRRTEDVVTVKTTGSGSGAYSEEGASTARALAEVASRLLDDFDAWTRGIPGLEHRHRKGQKEVNAGKSVSFDFIRTAMAAVEAPPRSGHSTRWIWKPSAR